jgi:tRNA (adenine37-N6)-methyltransferase
MALPDPRLKGAPTFEVTAVGVVRSPFKVHVGTPRQSLTGDVRRAEIELRPGLQNLLADLSRFSHVWLLTWLHVARGWNDQVAPPRDDRKRGLFATRAPHRPNPIGLSVVRLLRIEGATLHVEGVDLLDGTPVLDVKPYVPDVDAVPDASRGWLDDLADPTKPDHRDWRADKSGFAKRS